MHPILSSFETAYVEAQNILPLLNEYTNPRDFIARLVKKGELIRLKNGFFVISEKIKKAPVPYAQIANLLYGPSYLSFEWALSYYGMIPEGVYLITSTAATKSKNFKTPLGSFDYCYLSHPRYAIGIDLAEQLEGRFMIATPEKALSDLVYLKNKNMKTSRDMLVDLIEGRRMDEEDLRNLNKNHLVEIAECYRSRSVHQLVSALGLL